MVLPIGDVMKTIKPETDDCYNTPEDHARELEYNIYYAKSIASDYGKSFEWIVGKSKGYKQLIKEMKKAKFDLNVVIEEKDNNASMNLVVTKQKGLLAKLGLKK